MKKAAQDLKKRAAEFIQAAKHDAMENSQFIRVMSEVPRNKLLGIGALTGLGATGVVANGAELLTPAEAEAVISGQAYEDDRNAGYGAILGSVLLGTGGLLGADEYISRVRAAEAAMDEVSAMRQRHNQRKPRGGRIYSEGKATDLSPIWGRETTQ